MRWYIHRFSTGPSTLYALYVLAIVIIRSTIHIIIITTLIITTILTTILITIIKCCTF